MTGNDDDLSSFDQDVAVDGEYKVKHSGEKFSIARPTGRTDTVRSMTKTPSQIEEEELQKAL